jgi:acyl carrier protein
MRPSMASIPDRAEILERLRALVPEKVGIDPKLMQADANLADIGIDSFSLIELVFIAEEEFKISIPIDNLVVKTVKDVLDLIQQRIAVAAS